MTKRQWLKSQAQQSAAKLRQEFGHEANRLIGRPSRITLSDTETAGIVADIAELSGQKSWRLELWLDEITHELRLYYCVSTESVLFVARIPVVHFLDRLAANCDFLIRARGRGQSARSQVAELFGRA